MKKIVLTVLGLTLAGSLSQACPGGDIFQLKTQEGEIMANYKIQTGELVATSRSFSVKNAYFITTSKKGEISLGRSLCKGDQDCGDLNVSGFGSTPRTILFVYGKFDENLSKVTIANKVFLGSNATVAKSFSMTPPPEPQTGEVDVIRPLDCAKSNQ